MKLDTIGKHVDTCIDLITTSNHLFFSFWAAVVSLPRAAAWSKAEHYNFWRSARYSICELHHACIYNILYSQTSWMSQIIYAVIHSTCKLVLTYMYLWWESVLSTLLLKPDSYFYLFHVQLQLVCITFCSLHKISHIKLGRLMPTSGVSVVSV